MQLNKQKTVLSVLYFIFCLIVPWSTAAMHIIIFTLVFLSIIFSIQNKKSPITFHIFYIFPWIYIFFQFIAIANSPDWISSLKAMIDNEWYILALPFIASLPVSSQWRKRAFYMLLFSATISGIYGLFQFVDGYEYFVGKNLALYGNFYRAVGIYGFYLTYAGNQMLFFSVAFSFFLLTKSQRYKKIIIFVILVVLFLSIISTFGRSAWLAATFILVLGTFMVKKKYFIYLIIIFVTSAITLFFLFPEVEERFVSIFDPTQNEARLTIWRTSWNIFSHHPWFGIGPGFFNENFIIYKVPGFYDATGHAHNDYLNVAVVSGVFGLVFWICMWISFFYFSIKAFYSKFSHKTDKKIILASILGLTGFLIASVFQCYYTDIENNLCLWFLMSSVLIIINQRDLNTSDNYENV